MNPNFAPARAFLSVAYRQQKETKEKALDAGMQAAKLDPTRLAYVADVGDALLALDREKDARLIGERLTKTAKTPSEKAVAESFNKRLMRHQELAARDQGKAQEDSTVSAEKMSMSEEAEDPTQPLALEKTPISESPAAQPGGSEEGVIREAHCDASSGTTVRFAILGDTLTLSAPDVTKIEYRAKGKDSNAAANPCSEWNGRKARIGYRAAQDKKFSGEIVFIEFR